MASQAQAGRHHQGGDEQRGHGIRRRLAGGHEDHPDQHRDRAGQVRREVQGVRGERRGVESSRGTPARHRPRGVQRDHDGQHREGPPGRLHPVVVAVDQPPQRLGRDRHRHQDQERALPERGQMLGLAVAVLVVAVGRADRDPHRVERQQRRDQVGAGVDRLGDEGQRAGDQSGDELDRHQQDAAATLSSAVRRLLAASFIAAVPSLNRSLNGPRGRACSSARRQTGSPALARPGRGG